MPLIADTGPLYALADRMDAHHQRVVQYLQTHPQTLIVPAPVVPEVCYLLLKYLGPGAERQFLGSLASDELLLEHPSRRDLARVLEILDQYADARFGFVDAAVMALAERLESEEVLTLDHRDFSIFRPHHRESLRLVP